MIYLHFGDKVLRKLPSCLMESEGLMTQLKVCTDLPSKVEFDQKGGKVKVTNRGPDKAGNDGQPSSLPTERRTWSSSSREGRSRSRSTNSAGATKSKEEPKTTIDEATQKHLRGANVLWDIITHPEYAHDDDGLDSVMREEVLYYAVQGQVFADEAFCSRNFRSAKTFSRDVRRAKMASGEIPEGQSTLEEYQQAYRKYIAARRENRQGEIQENVKRSLVVE